MAEVILSLSVGSLPASTWYRESGWRHLLDGLSRREIVDMGECWLWKPEKSKNKEEFAQQSKVNRLNPSKLSMLTGPTWLHFGCNLLEGTHSTSRFLT